MSQLTALPGLPGPAGGLVGQAAGMTIVRAGGRAADMAGRAAPMVDFSAILQESSPGQTPEQTVANGPLDAADPLGAALEIGRPGKTAGKMAGKMLPDDPAGQDSEDDSEDDASEGLTKAPGEAAREYQGVPIALHSMAQPPVLPPPGSNQPVVPSAAAGPSAPSRLVEMVSSNAGSPGTIPMAAPVTGAPKPDNDTLGAAPGMSEPAARGRPGASALPATILAASQSVALGTISVALDAPPPAIEARLGERAQAQAQVRQSSATDDPVSTALSAAPAPPRSGIDAAATAIPASPIARAAAFDGKASSSPGEAANAEARASLTPPQSLQVQVPVQAEPLAPETAQGAGTPIGDSGDTPRDFATLVGRLAEAREAASPHVVRTSLRHSEFGTVGLQFRHDEGALRVTMYTPDPDFSASVHAAVASGSANAASGDGAASPGQQSGGAQARGNPQPDLAAGTGTLASSADAGSGQGQSRTRPGNTFPWAGQMRRDTRSDDAGPDGRNRRGGIYA